MTSCCAISSSDEESITVLDTGMIRGRKDHTCIECRETIAKGTSHECTKGLHEGTVATYRTCLLCVEIRGHFSCGGWIYERVWDDIEDSLFPSMTAGGECLTGLSPAAKTILFERCLAWILDGGHRYTPLMLSRQSDNRTVMMQPESDEW